jgi:hypothetical protein
MERRRSAEIMSAPIAARTEGRHLVARWKGWGNPHSEGTNSRVEVVDGALGKRQGAIIGGVPDAEWRISAL